MSSYCFNTCDQNSYIHVYNTLPLCIFFFFQLQLQTLFSLYHRTSTYFNNNNNKMKTLTFLLFTLVTLVSLAQYASSMGLCFGGGYPKCCQNGKNNCGPFCASCSRVGEFVRNMNMFEMMGMGMGTPSVFRVINNDPFVHGAARPVPFPAKPFPTNFKNP